MKEGFYGNSNIEYSHGNILVLSESYLCLSISIIGAFSSFLQEKLSKHVITDIRMTILTSEQQYHIKMLDVIFI